MTRNVDLHLEIVGELGKSSFDMEQLGKNNLEWV